MFYYRELENLLCNPMITVYPAKTHCKENHKSAFATEATRGIFRSSDRRCWPDQSVTVRTKSFSSNFPPTASMAQSPQQQAGRPVMVQGWCGYRLHRPSQHTVSLTSFIPQHLPAAGLVRRAGDVGAALGAARPVRRVCAALAGGELLVGVHTALGRPAQCSAHCQPHKHKWQLAVARHLVCRTLGLCANLQ